MRFRKAAATGGIILLLVVGALAWVWKQDRASDRETASGSAINGNAYPIASGVAANPGRADAAWPAPLPPLDMPVAAMFDDLKQRAERGDALASCRLAVELIGCGQTELLTQPDFLEYSEDSENELMKEGLVTAANSVASLQIRQLESLKRCAGISESQRKLAGSYLAQAARAGIDEAMIRYAEGQGLETGNSIFGMLQDKAFDQWRRDAPEFLQKALRGGEPAAVFVLFTASSDDNSLIGGLIADDPVQA